MLAQILLVCGTMLPGDPGMNPVAKARWETAATLQPRAVGRLLAQRIGVGMNGDQVATILGTANDSFGGLRIHFETYRKLELTVVYVNGKVNEVLFSKE